MARKKDLVKLKIYEEKLKAYIKKRDKEILKNASK